MPAISVSLRTTIKILIGILVFWSLERFLASPLFYEDRSFTRGFFGAFVFDRNGLNLSQVAAVILLTISSLMALLVTRIRRARGEYYLAWTCLSLLLLFLAGSENIRLIEKFEEVVKPTLPFREFFTESWIVLYAIAVLMTAALMVNFFRSLNNRIRLPLIAGFILFFLSEIAFEAFISSLFGETDKRPFLIEVYYATFIQDIVRFAGISVLLVALFRHLIELCRTSPSTMPDTALLPIVPGKVFRLQMTVIYVVCVAHCLTIIYQFFFFSPEELPEAAQLFNFYYEANVPTIYSSMAIYLSAILLFFIATNHDGLDAVYWALLGLIFIFLGVDETFQLHEKTGDYFRHNHTALIGVVVYPWLVTYAIAASVFLLVYLRFLFRLPREIAWLFVLSGSIFVLGAMGMEWLGGMIWKDSEDGAGYSTMAVYSISYTVEEFLEMLGIALFIYTLLKYIRLHLGFATLRFEN